MPGFSIERFATPSSGRNPRRSSRTWRTTISSPRWPTVGCFTKGFPGFGSREAPGYPYDRASPQLDRFKSINESFGYQAGDALLKEVGNRLKESVREFETLARLGGDEFAIILDDLEHEQEATVLAQRVLDTLASPFRVNGQEAIVTGSMGIAFYPENGDTIDQLLKCADSAMHRSKERGRNSYQIFSEEMHSEVLTRMSLERDLRHALERNEFRLHYQPQLSLEDNELLAVEALVRWEHADRGLIAPMDFIHLLEDSGLIITAGEWILRTACEQVREWQTAGFNNLRVAVNLSPRQFEDKNLVQVVGRALEDSGSLRNV